MQNFLQAVTVCGVSFEGKFALVTGGGGAIGGAVCRRLSESGVRVAVCDLGEEAASGVAGEVGGLALKMDVASTSSVRDAVARAESELGSLDILVNCAGIDEFGLFLDSSEESWDRILAVNLRGVIATCHAVAPGMVERKRGRIVNIASEAGRVGSSGEAVYSAAKGGVIAFTKALARELARFEVACNVVSPGPVDTPLLDKMEEDMGEKGRKIKEAMIRAVPLRRVGRPEEIAVVVHFLAGDDASFITGETVGVSGGLAMV